MKADEMHCRNFELLYAQMLYPLISLLSDCDSYNIYVYNVQWPFCSELWSGGITIEENHDVCAHLIKFQNNVMFDMFMRNLVYCNSGTLLW